MSSNLETRSLLDEWRDFDEGGFFDLGHPLLNRIAQSFVKAASIGAIQAVVREACLVAVKASSHALSVQVHILFSGICSVIDIGMWVCCFGVGTDIAGVKNKKHGFPDFKGEEPGKESLQWGLAAGLYSGLTYGLREARGAYDWPMLCRKIVQWQGQHRNGGITHMRGNTQQQVVQCAIPGAALSTTANLLRGIFYTL